MLETVLVLRSPSGRARTYRRPFAGIQYLPPARDLHAGDTAASLWMCDEEPDGRFLVLTQCDRYGRRAPWLYRISDGPTLRRVAKVERWETRVRYGAAAA